VTDRSGRIGLVREKRTVRVDAEMSTGKYDTHASVASDRLNFGLKSTVQLICLLL